MRVVFLDATDETLVRRYESVRRPQPFQAQAGSLYDGIRLERERLQELRASSDVVIDTSRYNVHELSTATRELFSDEDTPGLQLSVQSFGFKYGTPVSYTHLDVYKRQAVGDALREPHRQVSRRVAREASGGRQALIREEDHRDSFRPAQGEIPTSPGVYRFSDRHGRVLYIGKAKNLRARLANYFQPLRSIQPRTQRMLALAARLDWTVVATDTESLVLEHTWITEFQPPFNVQFKDDKLSLIHI